MLHRLKCTVLQLQHEMPVFDITMEQ